MDAEKKIAIFHRPNWHPNLSQLLGDFIGETGYVTEFGTIELLGPHNENPNIPEHKSSSKINGPTLILTAKSSLGLF